MAELTTNNRPAFRVGDRVRTIRTAFVQHVRTSRIAEINKNANGLFVYVLADGGWMAAAELKAAR